MAQDKDVPLSHFSVPFIPLGHLNQGRIRLYSFEDMHSQSESPIFSRLPGELRNIVYNLVLQTDSSIIDPRIPPIHSAYARSPHLKTTSHRVPDLGIALLRTCKRIYSEAQLEPLFAQNIFRFTTSFSAQRFLSSLPRQHRELIEDLEVDLRECSRAHPAVKSEWVQYLNWKPQIDSLWAAKVGSLRLLAPNVRTLRFNIEGWRVSESTRSLEALKDVFQGPRGLDRVVMTGMSRGELSHGSREKILSTGEPGAIIGIMELSRLTHIMEWMAKCVKGDHKDKVITWEEKEHRLILEILSITMFQRRDDRVASELLERPDYKSTKGACMFEQYERQWRSPIRPGSINA